MLTCLAEGAAAAGPWMAQAAGSQMWAQMAVWAGTTIVSVVATTIVTVKVMAYKVSAIEGQIRDFSLALAKQNSDLAQIREARSECELRSARTYATHAESAKIVNDQIACFQQIEDKLDRGFDDLHSRVTDVATRLADVAARQQLTHPHLLQFASDRGQEKESRG